MKNDNRTHVPCDHCGTLCKPDITLDDKVFCCHGCKSVYSLLWANGMESFYSHQDKNATPVESGKDYSFLDHPEIQAEVQDFDDGKIGVVRLFLPAIHCSACLWLLERLHKVNDGVISVRVEFSKRMAHIRYSSEKMTLRELAELLQKIGYPPQIRLADGEGEEKNKKDNRLIKQFGVAAFAFGNIMLMALPEYFYPDDASLSEYTSFFRYLSWALTLPVLIYSASDYFSSAWRGLAMKRVVIDQPIAIGILALFFQSTFEIFFGHGSGYLDSLAGLIFFLLMGKMFQRKTYESLSFERDYKSYFPLGITVVNDDNERSIVPVQQLKKGHRIFIRNEEIIPVDGVILSGDPMIDNSFVTGESTPERKAIGDKVFAGGKQCGGGIEVLVERPMDQSYLTQLWNDQNYNHEGSDRFRTLTDKVSKYFVVVVLFLALGAFGYWTATADLATAIHVFTAVLIVACPCALALAAPFASGHAMRLMGRNGMYLKRAEVVEAMAEINRVVWDKTGTLTSVNASKVEWAGEPLADADKKDIAGLMLSSRHPLSLRISGFLGVTPTADATFTETVGKGLNGTVNGVTWRIGSGSWLNANTERIPNVSEVWIEKEGVLLGAFRVNHAFRQSAKQVVRSISDWAAQTVVTGDDRGDEESLLQMFERGVKLRFKQKPHDKMECIKSLQSTGYHVAMIGDGLNDAGALMKSDVGISVAEDMNNFTPASDAILHAAEFEKLPQFFRLAKYTRGVIYASFALSFAYNIVGMYFAITGVLSPLVSAVLMPISSISVVAFVTLAVNRFSLKGKQSAVKHNPAIAGE